MEIARQYMPSGQGQNLRSDGMNTGASPGDLSLDLTLLLLFSALFGGLSDQIGNSPI